MAINKVGSKGIEDGSVATIDLAPGTVTNPKLANSSFTFDGTSISLGGSDSVNLSASWQSVITADGSTGTTAVAGNGYFIDTTSAAHTLTLPASATIGDFIAIKDYAGTFATNNLTIARNGHNIQGAANDSLISTNRASLVLVYVDSTKGWLYWEEHNVADLENIAYISATGGTITTSGDYKIHTFTGDGCFVVSTAPFGPGTNINALVVAGGGSGARVTGGGGAGGARNISNITVSATTYPITVGGGGSPVTSDNLTGNNGSNSVFSTITSAGGGGGGRNCQGTNPEGPGLSGGSGGGGGGKGCAPTFGAGGTGNTPPVSPPQGNNGGPGSNNTPGGGGGGHSAVGGTATPGSGNAGDGGAGTNFSPSFPGFSLPNCGTYAGGGGGGGFAGPLNEVGGIGGTGGGGPAGGGGPGDGTGTAGTANTGGGGGGAAGGFPGPSGAGGKGIVIIRYKFQ